jgi:hypothetical protein
MYRIILALISLSLFIGSSDTQAQRKYLLDRASEHSVQIDGILNEECWQRSTVTSDFTQTVPKPDQPSSYKTEVQLCYTDHALYIAARMYQKKGDRLQQLTARDALNRSNADVFGIFLDTYNDQQNGYVFKVSSAGVQQDERLSSGTEYGDIGWDAVWASAVKHSDSMWTVELEIPLSALRFTAETKQLWRFNLYRMVRKYNESSYWSPIDVNKQGFLAQTGLLEGIQDIMSPVRLFLFPYLSTGYLQQPMQGGQTSQWLRSGGVDLKYGLNESFTLDMTLVPDFSQVVSDNIVRNLSPFEQQLTENRPFFTEGTELFNKADLFYSRRIGGRPSSYYTINSKYGDTSRYEIEKNPNVTRLLNALKISGRTKRNTGIGIFNSIGSTAFAHIKDKLNNNRFREQTEPLSNYNVLVIDQPLKGQSYLNLTNTNVMRNGSATDGNVSSLEWVQFNKKENYQFTFNTKASLRNQGAFKFGTAYRIGLAKVSGKLTYSFNLNSLSPEFNQRDLGLQFDENHSSQSFNVTYNENKPLISFLQLYRISMNHTLTENTVPFKLKAYEFSASYFWLFKSFWDVSLDFESRPFDPIDYYQLGQYNKIIKTLPYYYTSLNGSSDSRKKLYWAFNFGYGFSDRKNADYINLSQSMRYLFGQRLELSLKGDFTLDKSNIGYSYYSNIINEPIIARRDVKEIVTELNLKLNFDPNTNLTARFRHYNSIILNRSFNTVDSKGNWENYQLPFTTSFDENYNLQNIDIFFNWMFKPGSRFVLSYKQWLNDAYLLNSDRNGAYSRNVANIVLAPKAFELSARFIYFLDYNSIKKHKK